MGASRLMVTMKPMRLLLLVYCIGEGLGFFIDNPDYDAEPACRQLGCDNAGQFVQADFVVPTSSARTKDWTTELNQTRSMKIQAENYGCVASSEIVACLSANKEGWTSVIMLNPDTGKEYDTTGYEVLWNITMPVLTKTGEVLVVNNSHISLVDPLRKSSVVQAFPKGVNYSLGIHSPVYLEGVDTYVISGNFSMDFLLYKTQSKGELMLLNQFQVPKNGHQTCAWVTVSELAARANRVYFYGTYGKDVGGYVALEITNTYPYVIKAWEFADDENGMLRRQTVNETCVVIPSVDDMDMKTPPVDMQIQITMTHDGYLVTTSDRGIIAVQDLGSKATQVFIYWYGAHYLTVDQRANQSVIWMTGWNDYEPFRSSLFMFNYSATSMEDAFVVINLLNKTGAVDLNVTSRITLFNDCDDHDKKILVFGVSMVTNSTSATFHTDYCPECQVGTNRALMAVRTAYKSSLYADIVWMYPLVDDMEHYDIKGQTLGIGDKLVFYLSDGTKRKVAAIQ